MCIYHREDDPECNQQEWSWVLTQLLLICLVSLYINKELRVESTLYFRVNQPVEDLVVFRLHLAVSVCHPTCFSSPALATAFFVRQVLKEHSYSKQACSMEPPARFSRWVLVLHSAVDTTSSRLPSCSVSLIEETFPEEAVAEELACKSAGPFECLHTPQGLRMCFGGQTVWFLCRV